jgi:hypothetical protein
VDTAAFMDAIIGKANLLDFFQVEKPLAIGKCMQRHDARQWHSIIRCSHTVLPGC